MKLLVDAMCGGIVSYLWMCGHDAAYALDRGVEDDEALVDLASEESRTIVTRDRALAGLAEDAILLESKETEGQLRELADAGVDLELSDRPERCGRCGDSLRRVAAGATPAAVPDPDEEDVWQCRQCGQFFWMGSHWDRVAKTLTKIETE